MKSKSNFYLTFSMILVAAAICFSAFTLPPEKTVELKYNLKKDQQFNFSAKSTQTSTVSAGGQNMVINQVIDMTQNVLVTEASEKEYSMNFNVNRIVFNQKMMGMEINWDSDNPDNSNPMTQQIAEQMGKYINNPMTTVIDSKGKILSSKDNNEELVQSNISGLESMIVAYPEGEIEQGHTWQSSLSPVKDSDYQMVINYTLEKIKSKTVEVSYTGTVTATTIAGQANKVNGTINGKYEIDIATGFFISGTTQQQMSMETEQEGMTINMTLNSLTEISTQ